MAVDRSLPLTWSIFKDLVTTKKLRIQEVNLTTIYVLAAFDGEYKIFSILVQDGNKDTADYEANFKSLSNRENLVKTSPGEQNYFKITASTTEAIQVSVPGRLRRITVNDLGTGNPSMQLYDGTVAGGILLANISLMNDPITRDYDIKFDTNLTLVATGSNFDVVVIYD